MISNLEDGSSSSQRIEHEPSRSERTDRLFMRLVPGFVALQVLGVMALLAIDIAGWVFTGDPVDIELGPDLTPPDLTRFSSYVPVE